MGQVAETTPDGGGGGEPRPTSPAGMSEFGAAVKNIAVVGAILYGILFIVYNTYYSALGMEPEDVGVTSTFLVVRSIGFLVIIAILAFMFVLIMVTAPRAPTSPGQSMWPARIGLLVVPAGLLSDFVLPQAYWRKEHSMISWIPDLFLNYLAGILAWLIVFIIGWIVNGRLHQATRRHYFLAVVTASTIAAVVTATLSLSIRASQDSKNIQAGLTVDSVTMLGLPLMDIAVGEVTLSWTGNPTQRPPGLFGDREAPTPARVLFLGQGQGVIYVKTLNDRNVYQIPASAVSISRPV